MAFEGRAHQGAPGSQTSMSPMVTNPSRLDRIWRAGAAFKTAACAPSSTIASDLNPGRHRLQQIEAAQTRLLYENVGIGGIVTVPIVLLLAIVQWGNASPTVVTVWTSYLLLVSVGRWELARRYWRANPSEGESAAWLRAFIVGTALAAAGWGAAAVAFYPRAEALHETFLVFVIGGVMLGGSSLLAARTETFLTFLLPAGLLTAVSLAFKGDREHLMMGFLAVLFTLATLATTWRFHTMIGASLKLRIENQDLIESLQITKAHTEALNRDLELRVRDRTARLTEADQRKDEFLATLAHELRNPLAPIRFALENLRPGASPAAAARARDVIDRQVRQVVRLVDDLLDVSRIRANKMVLRREPQELARLMTTAVESIMPLAIAADHVLTVELPPASAWINGDSARIVQVFANILNNSVKFTPRGGRIWVTAEVRADDVVVRIRDTGIGIAADVLPRMFDMFQQAEVQLERSGGGLGIGLTLARRLVEMHEGRIDVSSPGPGAGTQVEIKLPLTAIPAGHVVTPEQPPLAAARHLRVLIVEDSPDAAEMLNVAVKQLGHTTRVVQDGAAALAMAPQFAPDLVLLDIGLPSLNGYAVARALRQRPEFNHVHIAAVTGWGQEEDRRKAREAGFDSHFTKPLSPEVLEHLLTTLSQPMDAGRPRGTTPRTRLTDSGWAF